MLDAFQEAYYYLDLLIGFSAPVVFYILYRAGRIERFLWRCFWIGAIMGLVWEIPIFVLSAEDTGLPVIMWHRPLEAHYSIFLVCHSLWDGLIFVIGILLIFIVCRKPVLQGFSLPELAVMVAWGQLSALMVELSSIFNDGWSYYEYWWNPAIFHVNGHNVTILIQLVWLLASVAFYFIILGLRAKSGT